MNRAVLLLGAPCTQPEGWARQLGTAHASTVPDLLRWWQQARPRYLTDAHASPPPAQARVLLLAPDPSLPLHPTDEAADDALRACVRSLGLPLQVLYPSVPHGWAPAVQLALAATAVSDASTAAPPARAWHPLGCEDCSDPACERRLFQDLLAQRGAR